jgi:hypothetical protein
MPRAPDFCPGLCLEIGLGGSVVFGELLFDQRLDLIGNRAQLRNPCPTCQRFNCG